MGVKLSTELGNSQVLHLAGSTLRGQIFLEIGSKHKVHGKTLMLYLKGFEDAEFGLNDKFCGRAPIVSMEFPIAEWTNTTHEIQPGQYAFPFEIELPDWLPASTGVAENQNAMLMQIKYMLIAQIEGITALHYYKRRNVKPLYNSFIRHERYIIIRREETRDPLLNIQKTLDLKVGGFLGVGKSESITKITLEKDQFYPDEDIVVKLNCDNTKCSKAVKNMKVKLQRNILALGYNGKVAKSKKYI